MAATTIEAQLELLSKQMAEQYLVNRNYAALLGGLSGDISWIGTGEKEICSGLKEAQVIFAEELNRYDGCFEIEDSWFKGICIKEDVGLVLAILKLHMPKGSFALTDMLLRFTAVWRKEEADWKMVHIHNSIPDKTLKDCSYFNSETTKSSYAYIEEQLNKANYTDHLTNIHNMNGFIHDTEELFRKYPEKQYAFVKFGIRNFRYINRTYGYSFGDEVLKNIAKNLQGYCGNTECCARMEKDIFVILFEYHSRASLDKRIKKIPEGLLDAEILGRIDSTVSYNGGVYVVKPGERKDIISMLDKALLAQQSIHENVIGSHYVYYNDWMLERQFQKSRLLAEVQPAMQKQEFQLYIQPQYDIRSGELVAGEALCRWRKADGTIVPPNEFIPYLEENGMILALDFYMLDRLCRQIRAWLDAGRKVVPISINQSGLHIGRKDYMKDFCRMVDRYRIPHSLISFELTESTFVEKEKDMLYLASQLHRQDFLLAIDDFGTGYASLNLLSVCPADILKIDKCLLDDIRDNPRARSIITKVVELAHDIEMYVVCEGIETGEQLDYLREIGCDIGQGYYLGRPISADCFERDVLLK